MKRVMNRKKISLAVAAALALGGASVAQAGIGFKAGDWDVDFSGNVNGFATWNSCDNQNVAVAGGLVCNRGTGTGSGTNKSAIESGLLPSALVFSAKSRQMNMDVGVTIGLYPTIATGPGATAGGSNNALGSASINVRQNYLFFGDKSWGQVKVGRDIGLFASDAILSDMTLLGVGSGAAFLGGPTTLGRIGFGYIYTDWIPQITYTSPDFSGFKFAAGLFQGLNLAPVLSTDGPDPNGATLTQHNQPGFQGKVSYDFKAGQTSGKVWSSFMQQKVQSFQDQFGPGTGNTSINGTGWDIGGKIDFAGFEGVLYYYTANGIGTTAIGLGAAAFVPSAGTLDKRNSDGGYGQITYKWQQIKFGYSYGQSYLKYGGNESTTNNPTLVRKNISNVFGVYYALTQSLNLVGEYIASKSQAQGPGSLKDNAIALGAILFF